MPSLRISAHASLLLLLVAITSCDGQVRAGREGDSTTAPARAATGTARLVPTQGTGPGANIHCGMEDRAGDLWFGTTGEGVYRYDGAGFTNYTVKDGLPSNHVWAIYEDDAGVIWFGTADGICRFDGTRFKPVPMVVDSGSLVPIAAPRRPVTYDAHGNPSENNAVWTIVRGRGNDLWFGTSEGILRYDGATFTPLQRLPGVVTASVPTIRKVEEIVVDRSGTVWFGGRGNEGVFRFDGTRVEQLRPIGAGWVIPLLEDRSGTIWFRTARHSAYRYDRAGFSRLTDDALFEWITSTAEDSSGTLWFATPRGVSRFDGTEITTLTKREGLANDDAFSVTLDRTGKLWIGTREMGLSSFDGTTIVNHTERNPRSE